MHCPCIYTYANFEPLNCEDAAELRRSPLKQIYQAVAEWRRFHLIHRGTVVKLFIHLFQPSSLKGYVLNFVDKISSIFT